MTTFSTEHEVFIEARPETVWSFFVDPKKLVRWKGRNATIDPQAGGDYRITFDAVHTVSGRYVSLEPFDRLLFSWGWEGEESLVPPGSSTVEVMLLPEQNGTRVHLLHSGLPAGEEVRHAEGWHHYFARLAIAATGGDPGSDPWAAPDGS